MDILKANYQDAKSLMGKDENLNKIKLLNEIKLSCEQTIKDLEMGCYKKDEMDREITKQLTNKETKRNIHDYKRSLKQKIQFMHLNNNRLLENIKEQKHFRQVSTEQHTNFIRRKRSFERKSSGLSAMDLCKALGMNTLHLVDIDKLNEKVDELKRTIQETKDILSTKYVLKETYTEVLNACLQKEAQCDGLVLINNTLRKKVNKIKIACEAAELSAYSEISSHQRDSGALSKIVQQVVDKFEKEELKEENAEEKNKEGGKDEDKRSDVLETDLRLIDRPESVNSRDSDPVREHGAEMIMEYVERFSKLFSEKKFDEAIFNAIYSPKGILRTKQTLKYFRDLQSKKSYLVEYISQLMSTISTIGKVPSAWETIEAFKCAIHHERTDLIEFWLSKQQIELLEPHGDLLVKACTCQSGNCRCKFTSLAAIIYKHIKLHSQVIKTMVHQGCIETALSYAQFKAYTPKDYSVMLEEIEDIGKIASLMISRYLPLEQIVVYLVSNKCNQKAYQLCLACEGKRELLFNATHFKHWQGGLEIAEGFSQLCQQHDTLLSVWGSFMAACTTNFVLQNCQNHH